MTIILEVEEQNQVIRSVEIEQGDDVTVEAAAMQFATALGFLEAEEILEDLIANGERLERHQKLAHYAHHGNHWRHRHRRLRVIVFAPRYPDPKEFFWRRTLLVGEAAKLAANAFGYAAGNPGIQTFTDPPKTIDSKLTLEAAHVHCGEKLELVDTGGGVCDPSQ
jgi:hypothetical protein